ncbi:MAG TPA: Uma2 family endonuclease [Pyrinomonadaceae bacterium]|nr:Uma2 family endonuclease [Pyrinomonadaceae bacterium]
MITATVTNYYEIVSKLPAGSEIILRGQTFEDYEEIIEEIGENGGVRVQFDGEHLKIMTLSARHEKYVRLIERMIDNVSMRKRIKILSFGSTTMKSFGGKRGSEPDCSFYIQNADVVARKSSIDFSRDVPPDVVVEVDIHHDSLDKFSIYSSLRVPEFWLFNGESLKIFRLENEKYFEVEKSLALPILSADILTNFLKQLEDSDQFEILLEFEKWLENQ